MISFSRTDQADAKFTKHVFATAGQKKQISQMEIPAQFIRFLIPFGLLLLLIVSYLAINTEFFKDPHVLKVSEAFKTVSALVAALGFALALWQWLAARHEASLDKYYERLNTANVKYDAAMSSRLKEQPDTLELQQHLYEYFVFAELDNLEYVLEKHCLGYIKPGLVGRAMRHFLERCRKPEFRQTALKLVGSSGYTERTREVAKILFKLSRYTKKPEELVLNRRSIRIWYFRVEFPQSHADTIPLLTHKTYRNGPSEDIC